MNNNFPADYSVTNPSPLPLNSYAHKLRHILPTFLTVTVGTVLFYSLLHWFLGIRNTLLPIKDDRWNFWLPLIVPLAPLYLWLRPRLRALSFRKNPERGHIFLLFYAWVFIVSLLILSQNFLVKATEKHMHLGSIDEYDLYDEARRYTLDRFYVAKYYGGAHTTFSTGGRFGEHFNMDVYVVFPLLKDSTETANENIRFWYGLKFHNQISNYLNDEDKDSAYRVFYSDCISGLDTMDLYDVGHFVRKPFSDDEYCLRKAIEARTGLSARNCVVLMPLREAYSRPKGYAHYWLGGLFAVGNALFLFFLRRPDYRVPSEKSDAVNRLSSEEGVTQDGNSLRSAGFKFSITMVIILINVLIWAVMFLLGVHPINADADVLKDWGALEGSEVLNGAWWQLFTALFVHANIMHLAANMYALIIAGVYMEILFPGWAYVLLYLISGLVSWLAGIWIAPDVVRLGASGAIFGLFGALLGLLMTSAFPKEAKKTLLINFSVYVGISLLAGLGMPNTDNMAHLSGLLCGGFLGPVLRKLSGKSSRIHESEAGKEKEDAS